MVDRDLVGYIKNDQNKGFDSFSSSLTRGPTIF